MRPERTTINPSPQVGQASPADIGWVILTRLDGGGMEELSPETLRLKSHRGWVLHASNGPYWPSYRLMVPSPHFGHGVRIPPSASTSIAPDFANSLRKREGESVWV